MSGVDLAYVLADASVVADRSSRRSVTARRLFGLPSPKSLGQPSRVGPSQALQDLRQVPLPVTTEIVDVG